MPWITQNSYRLSAAASSTTDATAIFEKGYDMTVISNTTKNDKPLVYLDNSSTTRQYDEVSDLIYRVGRECFGNASSLHEIGFNAANLLYDARNEIKDKFYGNGDIIFTSGGTESDNTALISSCRKMRRRGNKVITTRIEHPAVLQTCKRLEDEGFRIEFADNDVDGYVEPQELKARLDEDTILVSVMTVNNEVGTIEPVIEISKMIKRFNEEHGTGIIFHTDAVQAFGKLPMDDAKFDLVSLSAHKIHGPKGIGALYVDKRLKLPPYICGGGQEGGYRSGTENIPGIAGFGLASKIACGDIMGRLRKMSEVNNYLRKGIGETIRDVSVNGPNELGISLFDAGKRCPAILSVSFHGTRGEVILHALEQDGIYVSTGSACSSHDKGDSHVLTAMSADHNEIEGTLRFSFSEFNTTEQMDYVIDRLAKAVDRFRRIGTYR